MKNTPTDITNMLIELMERISDEDLSEERLIEEINRCKTVAELSKHVLSVWDFQLRIAVAKDTAVDPAKLKLPDALEV